VERGTGFVMTVATMFVLLFVLVPQPLVNAALDAVQSLQTVSGP
jgi:hypothetical protein